MLVYSILHYNTPDITINCVKNIRQIAPDSPIVIVDNGSPDKSGHQLERIYANEQGIDIILTGENLGFARGNNVGYQYAIEKYNPDYIAVINNDVMISQPDFEQEITQYMSGKAIDVAGPDIITPEGNHQNPLLDRPFGTMRIIKQIIIDTARLWCLRLNIMTNRILGRYQKVSKQYHTKPKDISNISNCVLHGACIIYGRNYLSKSPYAFIPETFLYGEEMLLHDHISRLGLTTGICPSAQVLHLGGKSTDTSHNLRQRQIFKMKCVISSMCKVVKARISQT